MLFNSLSFLVFFPLTTLVYFLLPHRWRWAHLLACSAVFYAAFIPAYLLILLFMILIDYAAGILIERAAGGRRRGYLVLSLVANVGLLAVFKYFNFVNHNVHALAQYLRWNYPLHDLHVVLAIGLSFHTFQSMAYTIEVYRGRQPAERHLGIYALYVMFYPQLVAGPIERPQNLLPQFHATRPFDADRIFDGLRQMLWGLFKKMVVADRLAALVDSVYAEPRGYGGGWLLVATYFFAFQIYCDFSGYSDIAIGAARVLGYRLMTNFDRPYASASVAEFWRRWHISLSTWFRDYLYVPLGGSRVPVPRWCFNILVVFLVSGLWHGASWTFVVWGALHGVYLIASRLTEPLRDRMVAAVGLARHPHVLHAWRIVVTFHLVAIGWVFFRANSLADAGWVLSHVTRLPLWMRPEAAESGMNLSPFKEANMNVAIALVAFLLAAEWAMARGRERLAQRPPPAWLRWPAYYGIVVVILWLGVMGSRSFIYFQF
jgi:D-alanyl-lipoteichoic acid acyltransferase DltB (MBOAT superfamily)